MTRCSRGHFIPAASAPGSACHCTLRPRRPRYRRHRLGSDLWGQGLAARNKVIRNITLTGGYL